MLKSVTGSGNLVRIQNCPAAVNGNDQRTMALGSWEPGKPRSVGQSLARESEYLPLIATQNCMRISEHSEGEPHG